MDKNAISKRKLIILNKNLIKFILILWLKMIIQNYYADWNYY
jgi:hypothetical protein